MQARNRISLFLLSLTLTLANVAKAHPEYRVTVMGPANSQASDINNAGVVVGTYSFSPTSSRAFLNRGKGLVDLGTLGGTSSYAAAINDKGEVVGDWAPTGGEWRGFIYYRGKQRDIGAIPGHHTRYTDINNAGYITAIGWFRLDPPRSFLRSPNGKLTDIGSLPYENVLTQAFALNNRKQITGGSGPLLEPSSPVRTFIWTRGVMRDLGQVGFDFHAGRDINDRGQVTGSAALLQMPFHRMERAFLYSDGRMIDIDGRPATAGTRSEGFGINNRGHIVGTSDHLSGFIYRGRRMQSLDSLIDPKLGWKIFQPVAINDAGQIAATAERDLKHYAVRLDLIRPSVEGMAELELGEEAGSSAMSPAEAEADARAEAEALAREVVRPVDVEK